jgi:hypothetical protein
MVVTDITAGTLLILEFIDLLARTLKRCLRRLLPQGRRNRAQLAPRAESVRLGITDSALDAWPQSADIRVAGARAFVADARRHRRCVVVPDWNPGSCRRGAG